MADASKLKGLRRSGLGTPPPQHEARTDLVPEVTTAIPPLQQRTVVEVLQPGRIDGRTMRRSGRTVQFATRVSPHFDERIRQIAMREGKLLVEVLECALDAYEASKKKVFT